jgi:hypothetical protein
MILGVPEVPHVPVGQLHFPSQSWCELSLTRVCQGSERTPRLGSGQASHEERETHPPIPPPQKLVLVEWSGWRGDRDPRCPQRKGFPTGGWVERGQRG